MPCFTLLSLNCDVLAQVAMYLGIGASMRLLTVSKAMKGRMEADDVVFLVLKAAMMSEPKHNGRGQESKKWDKIRKRKASSLAVATQPQRKSRRLQVCGRQILINARTSLRRNSEYAHDDLTGVSSGSHQKMTLNRLRRVLKKWIPLDINHIHQRGSTILMECVRTRKCSCRQALMCTKELLQKWGADPNIEHPTSGMRAIHYCAARGMPKVVKLLLQHGAKIDIKGKGTFTTSISDTLGSRKRRLTGKYTPLEWAIAMRDLEIGVGVGPSAIRQLNECISILQNFFLQTTERNSIAHSLH